MKRILILLLFTSGSLVVLNHSLAQESSDKLQVMTYNIWNGFDRGKDTTRRAECIQWIEEKDPDVLALQELCGYTEEQLKNDAAQWGHKYAVILKTEGYPVGLTSKRPIILKDRLLDGLWHGMLHVETFGIDFFVVHLSPADCEFRFREAEIITEKVRESGSKKYMILGDFNAHSPFDAEWMKAKLALLEKYRAGKSEKYDNLSLDEFDYSVISSFLSLPTIDLTQRFLDVKDRFTYPAPVLLGKYRDTMEEVKETRERIDYILTSPNLFEYCTGVKVFNLGEADTFSDHYPVMAELSLSRNE